MVLDSIDSSQTGENAMKCLTGLLRTRFFHGVVAGGRQLQGGALNKAVRGSNNPSQLGTAQRQR